VAVEPPAHAAFIDPSHDAGRLADDERQLGTPAMPTRGPLDKDREDRIIPMSGRLHAVLEMRQTD
jgi:integrase